MALIQCPECSRSISDSAESCPSCGLPIKPRERSGHGIPALLSLFVPGLGQLVKGDYWAAIGVWVEFVAVIVLAVWLFENLFAAGGFASLLIAIVWIVQVVDTYRIRQKKPSSLTTPSKWEYLLDDNRVIIGLVIVIFGIIIGMILATGGG